MIGRYGNWSFSSGLNRPHLGFHLPAGYGGFAIVARFELQGDGTWADVGNRHVGRRAREFCREGGGETGKASVVGSGCLSHTGGFKVVNSTWRIKKKSLSRSAPLWPYKYHTHTHESQQSSFFTLSSRLLLKTAEED